MRIECRIGLHNWFYTNPDTSDGHLYQYKICDKCNKAVIKWIE